MSFGYPLDTAHLFGNILSHAYLLFSSQECEHSSFTGALRRRRTQNWSEKKSIRWHTFVTPSTLLIERMKKFFTSSSLTLVDEKEREKKMKRREEKRTRLLCPLPYWRKQIQSTCCSNRFSCHSLLRQLKLEIRWDRSCATSLHTALRNGIQTRRSVEIDKAWASVQIIDSSRSITSHLTAGSFQLDYLAIKAIIETED